MHWKYIPILFFWYYFCTFKIKKTFCVPLFKMPYWAKITKITNFNRKCKYFGSNSKTRNFGAGSYNFTCLFIGPKGMGSQMCYPLQQKSQISERPNAVTSYLILQNHDISLSPMLPALLAHFHMHPLLHLESQNLNVSKNISWCPQGGSAHYALDVTICNIIYVYNKVKHNCFSSSYHDY